MSAGAVPQVRALPFTLRAKGRTGGTAPYLFYTPRRGRAPPHIRRQSRSRFVTHTRSSAHAPAAKPESVRHSHPQLCARTGGKAGSRFVTHTRSSAHAPAAKPESVRHSHPQLCALPGGKAAVGSSLTPAALRAHRRQSRSRFVTHTSSSAHAPAA